MERYKEEFDQRETVYVRTIMDLKTQIEAKKNLLAKAQEDFNKK